MLNGTFFVSSCSDTRAMGRVLDVVYYDLSVTKAKGSVTFPVQSNYVATRVLCVTLDGQMVVMGFCGGCY